MENRDPHQIENLFHAALDLAPGERDAYLASACSGDIALCKEVESLIAAFEDKDSFIEQDAFDIGMKLMSGNSDGSMCGKEFGAYKILNALGRGGMGEVYLAEDTRLGRKVALKFLSSEFVGDNWAKRQLVKEAQSVAMLDHTNICAVHGMEEVDGQNFIVMQYVEGQTLSDLARQSHFSSTEVLQLAQQIVGALAEAHAHGIIHRDIKPRNIMVTPTSQVKVLDFGLAKTIQQRKSSERIEDSVSHLSQSGLLAGTVAYMSPEQLRGDKLDYRSDIFSIGAVLYELISGGKAFARDSDAEVISAILTSRPAPLTHTSSEIPQELVRIVFKCLEKDKERRYQSASELLYDLGNLQQDSRRGVRQRHFVSLRSAAALLFLIFFAASVFLYQRWNRRLTLAVLPITNESADAGFDYLEDGFADSVITKLSRLQRLRVNAFTTVSGYRGQNVEPQRVGRQLGVDAVLTGKLVRQGNSIVLQTTLISTKDGAAIWSEHYDINAIPISDLQEKVSQKIVSNLALQTGATEGSSLTARETKSEEAYREYLRGRFFWRNRNKENIQKAIDTFNSAIKVDPAFARAWAGLADCYVSMNTPAYGEMRTEEAMGRARAAAKTALDIDNSLPEAHTSLGVVNLKYDWDWREAEKQFRQAISSNPDYAPAHYWYSNLLLITGRQEEAIEEAKLARKLDLFSSSAHMNSCRAFYYGRQYERAETCLNEILKEDPMNVNAKYVLGFVYQQQGLNDKAIAVFQQLPETNKVLKLVALGYSYGRAGRKEEARAILAETEEMSHHTYIPPHEMAVIYLGLGDKDNAFAWLEKAYHERFSSLIYFTVDPALDSLRSDPRFDDLARRLNLSPSPPQT